MNPLASVRRGLILAMLGASALCPPLAYALDPASEVAAFWRSSVVTLEATRMQYDYFQPWSRQAQTVAKTGVVIGPREILTTGADLEHRTLIRLQKGGRGQWWEGAVRWVDYVANLATVTVADESFWSGLEPAPLSDSISRDTGLQIVRWVAGNLEVRKAEFDRFSVSNPNATDAAHVILELTADVAGAGAAEPAVSDRKIIGLVFAQSGSLCQLLPAPFIRSILDARDQGVYRGLGYFDFTWQPTTNPETHRYLRLPGPPRGVVVIDVVRRPGVDPVLEPRDILLQVDGFDVDTEGDYLDPDYGHLLIENLATRNKWAGDAVRLKIWRDGRELEVHYTLPRAEDAARLVPDAPFDCPPEYLLLGGLVFQPLTRDYLQSWGADWSQRAPFRLAYFRNEDPSDERPAVVILSQVLPDVSNLGYQDIRHLVVERVNGRRVSSLAELEAAFAEPDNGFEVIEFLRGETLQRLVLDADQSAAATRRVLEVYGITRDRFIRASP